MLERLGRHHGIRPRRDCRGDHAFNLVDRDRHRAWLHLYALAKLIAGKFADAKPAVLVLALVFAIKFAIG